MEKTEKTTNGIVDGVIWKQILIFFFPIMLGTLFQQLYNTVDSVVVGRFVGKEALAAVGGSAAQILNLLIGFFVGVGSGATVIVSQFFGAKEEDGVSRAVHTAMAVSLVGGALMTVIGLLCTPWLLRIMNTPPETMEDSARYLRVLFLFMIPNAIYNIGSGIFRAVGDSRRPLIFLVICCIVNVVLDLVFVLGFGMGVVGVAVATGMAQLVSAVLICVFMRRAEGSYRLSIRKIRFHGDLLTRTVRIGLPAGLQSVMYAVSNMIITATINGFGTATVAAWVVLAKVDAIFWLIISAFATSAMTFVGQNYGARRYRRVRQSYKTCMLMALGVAVTFGILCMIFGRYVFYAFSTDVEVVTIAIRMMMFMAPCYWLYVPIELTGGTLRGMGVTLIPTLITAIGICALRVVWFMTAVPVWHTIETVMACYPVTWILTTTAFAIYYRKTSRVLLPR